jgi:hypothetical protein
VCLAIALNVAGGACEIAGFLFVSIDLYRLQRHEFGPLWFERALAISRGAIVRSWRKLTKQKPTTHHGSATLGLSSSGGTAKATLRLETGGKPLEERVAGLEANFRELDREVEEQRLELNQAVGRVQANLNEGLKDLRERQKLREEEERTLRRRSLRFQWAGIPLFLLGVAFSVAGNVTTC